MVETYNVALVILGLAVFAAAVGPRSFKDLPVSLPIVYVVGGYVLFALPHGVPAPDVVGNPNVVRRLTELVVIVSLMGAGLKIDRPFSLRGWQTTWRLLGIVMPVTIAAAALLGWGVLGLHLATAVLLGAIVAPTDPVLASDIEAGPPLSDLEEDDRQQPGEEDPQERGVRFALTSEAGLNDGLAFPFTYLAILLAGVASPLAGGWIGEWVGYYVVYKMAVGVVVGYVFGYVGAWVIFRIPDVDPSSRVADAMAGAEALSGTLIIYGAAELLSGYGFVAVFVGALVLRHSEWEHDYYRTLDEFAVLVERLLMALVLVLFGGALAGGLLDPLTWLDVGTGLAILLVIRPLAGLIGLLGTGLSWPSRAVVSTFGIRGIGSFFYLAYAINEVSFQELELVVAADRLWALLGFVVLVSVLLHGVTATPVMRAFDRWEDRADPEAELDEDAPTSPEEVGGG